MSIFSHRRATLPFGLRQPFRQEDCATALSGFGALFIERAVETRSLAFVMSARVQIVFVESIVVKTRSNLVASANLLEPLCARLHHKADDCQKALLAVVHPLPKHSA